MGAVSYERGAPLHLVLTRLAVPLVSLLIICKKPADLVEMLIPALSAPRAFRECVALRVNIVLVKNRESHEVVGETPDGSDPHGQKCFKV